MAQKLREATNGDGELHEGDEVPGSALEHVPFEPPAQEVEAAPVPVQEPTAAAGVVQEAVSVLGAMRQAIAAALTAAKAADEQAGAKLAQLTREIEGAERSIATARSKIARVQSEKPAALARKQFTTKELKFAQDAHDRQAGATPRVGGKS